MQIEAFIEARLAKLESSIRNSQMNINGVDINQQIRNDIQATRTVLKIAAQVERSGNGAPDAPPAVGYAQGIRQAVACRWSDHRDFDKEWLWY